MKLLIGRKEQDMLSKHQERLWAECVLLLLATFLTTILLGNQSDLSWDDMHRLAIAKSLWFAHRLPKAGSHVDFVETGLELKYGIVEPLAMMPFYGLGYAAAIALGTDVREADRWGERAVIELYTVAVALALVGSVYLCLRLLGVAALPGAVWSWCLLFATPVGVYVRTLFSEPLSATFIVASVFFVLWQRKLWAELAAYGCAAIAALNNPVNGLWFAALPVLLTVVLRSDRQRTILRWGAVAIVALAIQAWYNLARYGILWEFGGDYGAGAFSTPLLTGVYGLLFSVGVGLVLHSPLTLYSILAPGPRLPPGDHGARFVSWAVAYVMVVGLVVYGKWYAWFGGLSWGPRFLVQFIPLAHILGYRPARQAVSMHSPRSLAVLGVCLAAGILLNGLEYAGKWMGAVIAWMDGLGSEVPVARLELVNLIPAYSPVARSFETIRPLLAVWYVFCAFVSLGLFMLAGQVAQRFPRRLGRSGERSQED